MKFTNNVNILQVKFPQPEIACLYYTYTYPVICGFLTNFVPVKSLPLTYYYVIS